LSELVIAFDQRGELEDILGSARKNLRKMIGELRQDFAGDTSWNGRK
jgi:hypothetical protein